MTATPQGAELVAQALRQRDHGRLAGVVRAHRGRVRPGPAAEATLTRWPALLLEQGTNVRQPCHGAEHVDVQDPPPVRRRPSRSMRPPAAMPALLTSRSRPPNSSRTRSRAAPSRRVGDVEPLVARRRRGGRPGRQVGDQHPVPAGGEAGGQGRAEPGGAPVISMFAAGWVVRDSSGCPVLAELEARDDARCTSSGPSARRTARAAVHAPRQREVA